MKGIKMQDLFEIFENREAAYIKKHRSSVNLSPGFVCDKM